MGHGGGSRPNLKGGKRSSFPHPFGSPQNPGGFWKPWFLLRAFFGGQEFFEIICDMFCVFVFFALVTTFRKLFLDEFCWLPRF